MVMKLKVYTILLADYVDYCENDEGKSIGESFLLCTGSLLWKLFDMDMCVYVLVAYLDELP